MDREKYIIDTAGPDTGRRETTAGGAGKVSEPDACWETAMSSMHQPRDPQPGTAEQTEEHFYTLCLSESEVSLLCEALNFARESTNEEAPHSCSVIDLMVEIDCQIAVQHDDVCSSCREKENQSDTQ